MEVFFRQCTQADLFLLQDISRRTFREAFSDGNDPKELQAYLDRAYEAEKLRSELAKEHSLFYFVYRDGVLAGYLKVNESPAQTDIHDAASLQIERLFITKDCQGLGLGSCLINRAMAMAWTRKKRYIWLGVWEKNDKAISFYKKHGFYRIGEHSFFVGNEEQTDYIMRKDMEGEAFCDFGNEKL